MKSPGRRRYLFKLLLVFGAYFVSAFYGLKLGAVSGFATLVWPPTGIALASILLGGYRLWPAVFLAAFLVNLQTGAPLLVAVGIGIGNTLEAMVGAFVLRRIADFRSSLERLKDVLSFIGLAAVGATTISATIGVTSLWLGGVVPGEAYGATWQAWWIGDMLGALVVAPLILTFGAWKLRPARPLLAAEAFLHALLIVATSLIVFGGFVDVSVDTPLAYIIFLPLIAVALRLEQRGAALAILILSSFSVWGTAQGYGPFIRATLAESLLYLQLFVSVTAVTTMVLAAVASQRSRAEQKIRQLSRSLEQTVRERTIELNQAQKIAHVGSWQWNIPKNLVTWSDELYRIYGLEPQAFKATYEGFLERVHPEDRERVDRIIKQVYADRQPFAFFHRIVRPDGTVRNLQARGKVVADSKGTLMSMYGTGQDVTELKKVETELRQRTEELETMNKTMIGRELKMIELKKEIETLKEQFRQST